MPTCETCRNFLLETEVPHHKCPPRFECALLEEIEEVEGATDVTWSAVYAKSPAQAAEKLAESFLDNEGKLRVRVRNQHGVHIDLQVEAEYTLRFDAGPVGHYQDPGYWDRRNLADDWKFHERTEPVQAEAA
jgi:hypothetical protein